MAQAAPVTLLPSQGLERLLTVPWDQALGQLQGINKDRLFRVSELSAESQRQDDTQETF